MVLLFYMVKSGSISCTSSPSVASVTISGYEPIEKGIELFTPVTVTGLIPGGHRVTMKLDGYSDCSLVVEVTEGKTTPVDCYLRAKPYREQ